MTSAKNADCNLPIARIICVMDAPQKYPGEKMITVICPFCGQTHNHLTDAIAPRTARCDAGKKYQVQHWGERHDKKRQTTLSV